LFFSHSVLTKDSWLTGNFLSWFSERLVALVMSPGGDVVLGFGVVLEMKKIYCYVSIAILLTGCALIAAMAAGANQGQLSGSSTANTMSGSSLTAQSFRHKELVWTPGAAVHGNVQTTSGITGIRYQDNSCILTLSPSGTGEFTIPVTLNGPKRYVRYVTLCSAAYYGEEVCNITLYNGRTYLATANGTGKNFNEYQENVFDFGSYYRVDRGLAIKVTIVNPDEYFEGWFHVESVGTETRW
jgi:hypothetical protein